MPRLHNEAAIAQTKKTKEGGKRSAIVSTANNKVPVIKPNCTALVRFAKKLWLRWKLRTMSGITALPANHNDVQKNWEITIAGKIHFGVWL